MNNPYANLVDIQRQTWENAADLLGKLEKVDEANRTVADVEVGGTPSEVVHEENKLELLHYEPRTDEQFDVPVLFVYALFNKPFILDLQPDRSVIRTFLDHGFDVYMIDWNEPSLMDHALTFEDYVDRYIDDCVNVIRERSGQDAIDFFGYCMGGTMSLLYAALYPERVRNLGLMAASVCLKGRDSVLDQWIGDDFFDLEVLTDTFGNAPAEFLDAGFSMRDPVQNNLTKYIRFFDGIEDEEFVENFARMERWIDESIDVPGRMFVDFVDAVYHEQKLYDNEMYVGGRHADVENLTMPIAQVVGTYDHVVPPEAPKAFNEVLPSDDVTVFQADTGHMGLAVSGRTYAELWPEVCEWYEERSGDADPDPDDGFVDVRVESTPDEAAGTGADGGLEAIDGVGPTYAGRLRDAGIESVGDLAAADAAALAGEADVSVSRLEDWIEQAREMTT